MACERNPGTGPDLNSIVTNWSQEVVVIPRHLFNPSSIDQLVAIVKTAEADGDNGSRVRAIGSAWSFTNIIDTPDYLVVTEGGLNRVLPETMSSNPANPRLPELPSYTDPVFSAFTVQARGKNLVHVEAGITIHEFYFWLENFKANNIPPGVTAGDGPHGWAVPTLGGSGGQTIVGAISTSTHGGDLKMPPLPDMVRAIHLVGSGGFEWWIEPGSQPWQVVDPNALANSVPCVAGRIIFNDDLFNAVLVFCGRMGIIYSIVIEVVPQFFLKETRSQQTWNNLRSSGALTKLRADNYFLQVLILPYDNGNNDHNCYVTTRQTIQPMSYKGPVGPPGFSLFNFICDNPNLNVFLQPFIMALSLAALAALAIPFYGIVLSLQINAVVTSATLILNFGGNIGQALAVLVDGVAGVDFPGFTGLAATAINGVLSSSQSDETDREDLSYTIMDTYDYNAGCFKALSMEVAFDADDTAYIDYLDAVFGIINQLKDNRQMVGAYISLRYCGSSRAMLAIEQWENTVCIEIAGLKDLQNDPSAIARFEAEAANRGATVHWGQINNRTFTDTQKTYPQIERWRASLRFIVGEGSPRTFDNDFCYQRGLEIDVNVTILDGKVTLPDTSYGVPVLAAHDSLLFLAWKGSNNTNLNVEFSGDAGNSFGGKHISPETSDAPPTLIAHDGILFIAWQGTGNDSINVAQVSLNNTNGEISIQGIVNKNVLSDTTDITPALASHDGLLFLAWKGSNNTNLNIQYSTDDGLTFIGKFVSGETTDTRPTLASHNGALFIAWRGTGNGNLNVAQIDLIVQTNSTISGIRGFKNKVTLTDTTSNGFCLASIRQLLYIGWKGSTNNNLNVMASQDNGRTFVHKSTSDETSDDGPALAWFNDRCIISWQGSSNDNINVARVNLTGDLADLLLERHSGRLVQSSFGVPGNFEVVVLEREGGAEDRLVHYFRDNSDLTQPWHRDQVISSVATSSGSLIQSSFLVPDFPGNFEVVVVEGHDQLVHYSRDNSDVGKPWQRKLVISSLATGPGSIIQSSFGTPRYPGNFEVVVLEGNNLVHYFLDNSNPSSVWQQAQVISSKATGPGSIMQSNLGLDGNMDDYGTFEVVVLEGHNLVHYQHDNSDVNLPWKQMLVISEQATGPGTIIQSTLGGAYQNFEVVVLEGSDLVHYLHDNSQPNSTWQRGQVISAEATGPGSIIQGNFGLPSFPGNFEVIVLEGHNLVHYWYDNSNVIQPWTRTQTISTVAIG